MTEREVQVQSGGSGSFPSNETAAIDFQTSPADYRHWKLAIDGGVAVLALDVDEGGGLKPGYELKLNSYDLGVDIELADAVPALALRTSRGRRGYRLPRPRIGCSAPAPTSACSARSAHAHKVNFCKFTNETRCSIEDAHRTELASAYISAPRSMAPASGGGYELCARLR